MRRIIKPIVVLSLLLCFGCSSQTPADRLKKSKETLKKISEHFRRWVRVQYQNAEVESTIEVDHDENRTPAIKATIIVTMEFSFPWLIEDIKSGDTRAGGELLVRRTYRIHVVYWGDKWEFKNHTITMEQISDKVEPPDYVIKDFEPHEILGISKSEFEERENKLVTFWQELEYQ